MTKPKKTASTTKFWALGALGVLALLVATVLIGGALLPVEHTASMSAHYAQPPATVFATIADFSETASWRPGVDSMEELEGPDGIPLWREHSSTGPITYRVEELDPPRLLRTRIADEDLPFGGTWTYQVAAEGSGSRLTITEGGEVYNWVFRFMSRFVFGHTATMETYLIDLGRRFGEDVEPSPDR